MQYQHLRVQCDTKACNILFIACFIYDVDIQFKLFTDCLLVHWYKLDISGAFITTQRVRKIKKLALEFFIFSCKKKKKTENTVLPCITNI